MKFLYIRFGLPTGIALVMLALAAVPIGGAAEAPDQSSPTNQFLTAYNSMSLADWLKEKGLRAEATDLYTEALNLFLKVSADYPQWQPAVVAFRINYCRVALGSVERKAWSVERGATTDDGRPTTEDSLKRTTDARRQTPTDGGRNIEENAKHQAPPERFAQASRPGGSVIRNQKSEIENRKSKISDLSPLNLKLQQAALK